MFHLPLSPAFKKIVFAALATAIVAGMVTPLIRQSDSLIAAVGQLSPGSIAAAVVLCLLHRLVNAAGWGLVLRSLGEPVRTVAAIRIWLASEACRWLPGSLWSFGSRGVLASVRGVPTPTVAFSLLVELVIVVMAWGVVAVLGLRYLQLPHWLMERLSAAGEAFAALSSPQLAALIAVTVMVVAWVCRSLLRGSLSSRFAVFQALGGPRPQPAKLALTFGFFVLMSFANGLILEVIVNGMPGGGSSPRMGLIAANAIAWLIGFFAIFAPGGLVVREVCLAGLLSAWMPAEQALTVALAWRLVQILAELIGFTIVAATGLPKELRHQRSESEGSFDHPQRLVTP